VIVALNRYLAINPFLQANVAQSPQIQIDCIMPYMGSAGQLMAKVCAYLSKPDPQIEAWPNVILNRSTESTASGNLSVIL
jgi:hypothetical protein